MADCSTGFCTCVLLTDCMMIGEWVLACLAVHAWTDEEVREEDESMDEAGEGEAATMGMGLAVTAEDEGTGVEEATEALEAAAAAAAAEAIMGP